MSAGTVTFSLAQFAQNYCWPGPSQYGQDLIALLTGTVTGGEGVIIGPDLPDPEDQDKAWFRTVGGYLEGIYIYNGAWARPHPVPAGGSERKIWVGTLESLKTYEGGADEAVTATTGPFWEEDTNFRFRIPMGVGTNGTAYNGEAATSITVGDVTKGAEKVVLSSDETAPAAHKHCVGRMQSNSGGDADDPDLLTGTTTVTSGAGRVCAGAGSDVESQDISTCTGDFLVTTPGEAVAGADPADAHENLPPVIGVYVIKRSSRVYFTVTS